MVVPYIPATMVVRWARRAVDPGGEWRLFYRWLSYDGTPDRPDPVTVVVLAGGRVRAVEYPRGRLPSVQ